MRKEKVMKSKILSLLIATALISTAPALSFGVEYETKSGTKVYIIEEQPPTETSSPGGEVDTDVDTDTSSPGGEVETDVDTETSSPGGEVDTDTSKPVYQPDPEATTPGVVVPPETSSPGGDIDTGTSEPSFKTDPEATTPGYVEPPESSSPGGEVDSDTSRPGYEVDPKATSPGHAEDPFTSSPGYVADPPDASPGGEVDTDTSRPGYVPESSERPVDTESSSPGGDVDSDTYRPGYYTDPDTSSPGYVTEPETSSPGGEVESKGRPMNYVVLKGGIYNPSEAFDLANIADVGDSAVRFNNRAGFAGEIAYGRYILPVLAIELGAGYFQSRGVAVAQTGRTMLRVVPLVATGKFFIPLGPFEPYALGGIGAYISDLDVNRTTNGSYSGATEVTYGLHAGAGFNINFTDRAFAGLEGKYLWVEPSFGGRHIRMDGYITTLNVGFRF